MAADNSNFVQELAARSNDEVPEQYVFKDLKYGAIDTSVPHSDIPIIDVSSLLSSSSEERQKALEQLKSALSSWGCFQAVNHGIESSFLDKVREIGRNFFSLPMKEKQIYSREMTDGTESIDGYGYDTNPSGNKVIDWCDRLSLIVYPEDLIKLKYWPENPKLFREVMDEYRKKIRLLSEQLLRAMASSLNLDEECFLKQYGDNPIMNARYNLYPPCPRPDSVLGLRSHADATLITLLLQDKEAEGLQILKDNHWFKVPIISHALVVNLGDQLEIMSNGIWKSPIHRVVTSSERERMTLAMFCMPDPKSEIGPIEDLVTEKNPRLYKTVTNYVESFFSFFEQDKRPIEAVKI